MLPILTKEQISERYETLPESLQKAIFLPANTEEVFRSGRLNHLSEEKISKICRVIGLIFWGFLDVDDFAQEIKEFAEIPPELAGSITRDMRKKIFSFHEADLVKVYSPISGVLTEKQQRIEQKTATKPETGVNPAPIPAPMPSLMPREAGKIPAPVPLPKVIGEIKIAPQSIAPALTSMPAPATPPLSTTPFILHKEEVVKSTSGAKPIDLSFSLPETKKVVTAPLVAAELELSEGSFGVSEKKEPAIAKTEEPTQRIVHYSNFHTPINPFEGKKNPTVTITPPTAQEATPASALMASTPPAPARIPAASAIPAPTAPQPPLASIPPEPMPISPAPAPNVKMEGNVVDLRQK